MVITDPPRIIELNGSVAVYATTMDLPEPPPSRVQRRLDTRTLVKAEQLPVGTPFETAAGEPGVVVNAATAQAVLVGLRELRRRRQRAARRSRSKNRGH